MISIIEPPYYKGHDLIIATRTRRAFGARVFMPIIDCPCPNTRDLCALYIWVHWAKTEQSQAPSAQTASASDSLYINTH